MRMAEDVHQQSVRARGAVQLPPVPVCARACAQTGGMCFAEPLTPAGVSKDRSIAAGMEVAVAALLIFPEQNARIAARRDLME